MDRDDSLSLTSPTLGLPTLASADSLARVPRPILTEALALQAVMLQIHGAKKKRPAMAAAAQRSGIPMQTLKRHYYGTSAGGGWAAVGLGALIDHRRCGGCGLAGCTHETEVAISEETIRHWQAGAINNDKRALTESWKAIIRDLAAGKAIPGAGTWRDIFRKAHPFQSPPAECPWSLHRPPPGWSSSNFMRFKPAKAIQLLGKKGSFAAWSELPEVRVDLTTLRPFEWLVFDDHRLDFKVFVDVPGRGVQLVELWGLFVMDVSTRMIVSFGLKPRIAREDGSTMSFEHRDMQHLIANVVTTYGVPADWPMTLIVENAAAAVSTETENLLTHLFGGRLRIKRTGIQVGDFRVAGFPERWGNYRGKRWLEVWFAALDIIVGGVKGQMGSDYWSKPGAFDARQAFGQRLTRLLDHCTPEVRAKLDLPFEWAGQGHWIVSEAIDLLNHRQDHELEGFETVRQFAFDRMSRPVPLHPDLARLHGLQAEFESFSKVPQDLQQLWLSNGGTPRRMSPAEKLAVIRPKMQRISPATLVDLMFDEVTRWKDGPLVWRGGDCLDIEIRRGRSKVRERFQGRLDQLNIGDRVIARFNADHLGAGLWVLDERRRLLGHLQHQATPGHDDVEGLQRMLGQQVAALGQAKKSLNRILLTPDNVADRIGNMEQLTETIHTAARTITPAPEEIPALPESTDLMRAVNTPPRRRSMAPAAVEDPADIYTRLKGH